MDSSEHPKIQRTHSNLGDKIRNILGLEAPRSRKEIFLSCSNLPTGPCSLPPKGNSLSVSQQCTAPPPSLSRSLSSSYKEKCSHQHHLRTCSQTSPRRCDQPAYRSVSASRHDPTAVTSRSMSDVRAALHYRFGSNPHLACRSSSDQRSEFARSLSHSNKSKTWNERTCLQTRVSTTYCGINPGHYSFPGKPLCCPAASYTCKETQKLYAEVDKSGGQKSKENSKSSKSRRKESKPDRGGSAGKHDQREGDQSTYTQPRNIYSRHSIHFDSIEHALSGIETLDVPVRKKTWPAESAAPQCRNCSVLLTDRNVCYGRTQYPSHICGQDDGQPDSQPGERKYSNPAERKYSNPVDRKYSGSGERKYSGPGERKYSGSGERKYSTKEEWRGERANTHARAQCCAHSQCCSVLVGEKCCSSSEVRQPRYIEGPIQSSRGTQQPRCVEGQGSRDNTADDSSMETNSLRHLWNGVSGVPGLGVSVQCPSTTLSLKEWDDHAPTGRWTGRWEEGSVGLNGSKSTDSSGKLELPRILSPRSSSCRSSGRSTGSSLSHGLSSSSSSKYSHRSDSVFSSGHHATSPTKFSKSPEKGVLKPSRIYPSQKSKSNPKLDAGCECVCTCGEVDPTPPARGGGGGGGPGRQRRVMFTDECNCEENINVWQETMVCGESRCDCERDGVRSSHYQSPKEVDGDYSYAYSDSVSPAFLIRINASMEYNDTENIYEEITETTKQEKTTSSESIRSIFQRAKDSVRRSSRNLEPTEEADSAAFHMSISKGRKKTLIGRANVDWDNEEEELGPNHSISRERINNIDSVDAGSPSSPSGEDTQDDSGFHSGGMEEPNRRKKSKNQRNAKINRCESMDLVMSGGGEPRDGRAARSRILEQHNLHSLPPVFNGPPSVAQHPPASLPHHPPPSLPLPPPPQPHRKKSYLSRLVSPFLKGSQPSAPPTHPQQQQQQQQQQPPPHNQSHYGPNNNIDKFHEESGRTFYL